MPSSRLFALALPACLECASAFADTPPSPNMAEQLSLQSFGAAHPECQEWSDGCAACRRDARCSTPGVACEPGDIVCKAP